MNLQKVIFTTWNNIKSSLIKDKDLNKNYLYLVESPGVIETYTSGTDWYRLWSDGWCEQGGQVTISFNKTSTVTLLKSYKNTTYSVFCNFFANANIDDNPIPYVVDTTKFNIRGTEVGANNSYSAKAVWHACGYIDLEL